jgi:hypothetical protein
MAVTVTDPNFDGTLEPKPGLDVTPTGNAAMTGLDTGKVIGSDGNDRATLFDLQKDSDQIIRMLDGDDVFVFGPNDTNVDINGLVFMGDGGNDQVFLNHLMSDYVFTARVAGGIKIHFIGDPDGSGDAVTFYGAETFTFRNIDDSGLNYVNTTYTHDELYALILAGTPV